MSEQFVTVTQEFIIDAITKNYCAGTLRPDRWINVNQFERSQNYEDCEVCAVGAIFREVISARDSVSKICDLNNFISTHVPVWTSSQSYDIAIEFAKSKDYLSALSIFFEGSGGDYQETIQFIEDNFPATIKIPINGFDLSPALAGKMLNQEPNPKLKE